jgi:hypothetical protein
MVAKQYFDTNKTLPIKTIQDIMDAEGFGQDLKALQGILSMS